MKIAVCGCSISSPSTNKPPHYDKFFNTHFTELLKADHEVFTFAKAGVSNYHIRLQIEQAIKQRPDVVILTPTNTARLELNIKSRKPKKNKFYVGCLDEIKSSTMISIHESARFNRDLDTEDIKALNYYFNKIYNFEWEKKKQIWIINDAINELNYNEIPCIFQPGLLTSHWNKNFVYEVDKASRYFNNFNGFMIPYEDSIIKISIESKEQWFENDPGYHTTVEAQNTFYRYLVEKALPKINNI